MRPLGRTQRIVVGLWLVLAVALWNGIFEMMVVRGVKEYLFRAALFEAGRGPLMPIAQVMDPAIFHATWVATIWSCVVLLAAMLTIRWVRPGTGAQTGGGSGDGPQRTGMLSPQSERS